MIAFWTRKPYLKIARRLDFFAFISKKMMYVTTLYLFFCLFIPVVGYVVSICSRVVLRFPAFSRSNDSFFCTIPKNTKSEHFCRKSIPKVCTTKRVELQIAFSFGTCRKILFTTRDNRQFIFLRIYASVLRVGLLFLSHEYPDETCLVWRFE